MAKKIKTTHLITFKERLDRKNISSVEFVQRKIFTDLVKEINIPNNSSALSVSTGNGVWDYLVFLHNPHVKKIVATDIIDNPINLSDKSILDSVSNWSFKKVATEKKLPFKDGIFHLIYHHDVVEHVNKPYLFLSEQYRVLKKGGVLLFSTPNLFRPANIIKLFLGKLKFPLKIGYNKEIGEYIHVQEFYDQQMITILKDIGYKDISVLYGFFGIHFFKIVFQNIPKQNFGKSLCNYLIFFAENDQ